MAARRMRIALVDRARERQAMKRGGSVAALTLEQITVLWADHTTDVLEVNEALDQLAKMG